MVAVIVINMRCEVNFRSAPDEMQPVSFADRTAAADKTTLHANEMITKNANVVRAISRIFFIIITVRCDKL